MILAAAVVVSVNRDEEEERQQPEYDCFNERFRLYGTREIYVSFRNIETIHAPALPVLMAVPAFQLRTVTD